ncbi:MAG: hypothetical protein ABI418_13215, partial [Jatrophihabitantaceae bacterium]
MTTGAGRLRDRLRTELPARLAAHTDIAGSAPDQRRQLGQRLAGEIARAHTEAELMANRPLLDGATERQVLTEVLDETFGMAGLQPLLDDPRIENINVNGCDRVFVRYSDGARAQLPPIAQFDQRGLGNLDPERLDGIGTGHPGELRLVRT